MLPHMGDATNGKLLFIVLAATVLSAVAALLIARSYRSAMKRLMSLPAPASSTEMPPAAAAAAAAAGAPRAVTRSDNRRAVRRVALRLVGLSALIAASDSALFLGVAMAGEGLLTPGRWLTLSLINLWPVIPVLALLGRWSRARLLGVLALWFLGAVALIAWRSIEPQPLGTTLAYFGFEIGAPMLLIGVLCLGGAARAIAPWLMPLAMLLVAASLAGADLLSWIVEARPQWLMALPAAVEAHQVMLFFVLAPWLLVWWPAKWLGRLLSAAYARQWLSELMVLFTSVWGIVLLLRALGAWQDMRLGAVVLLLPLAWIPLAMLLVRRRTAAAVRPPTLLVLRVFQRDAQVQSLFDQVIERWRVTGNTVLIAGTDLVERTIDAGDIFDFLDGRLAGRFVREPAELAPRIAAFEWQPDAEGRHRVNEVYCHDRTWQRALDALVAASDVVLMDLRGFQAHNRGCRHELGVLARAPALARVVLLTDGKTALPQAREDAAAAPAGRFVWLDGSRAGAAQREAVLAALFVADTAAHEHRAAA